MKGLRTDYGFGWAQVPARLDHSLDCFLCCPGPSLIDAPTELRGPGRIIYGMNTSYPRVKPDVWIGSDRIACYDRALWSEPFPKICRHYKGDTAEFRYRYNVFFAETEDVDASHIFTRREGEIEFVWPRNTLLFALHYIVWSGGKRIFFVGCDMGGQRDYWHNLELSDQQRQSNRDLYAAQTETLRWLTPIAERHGVTFTSCTEVSPLTDFMACMPLEAALAASASCVMPPGPIVHSTDADRAAGILR